MPITMNCECGQRFRLKDELAGKQVKCPSCGQSMAVAAGTIEAPPVEVAPVVTTSPPKAPSSSQHRRSLRSKVSQTDSSKNHAAWTWDLRWLESKGAKLLLGVGLLLVIVSRGCHSVGARYVGRLQAEYSLAQGEHKDKYHRLRRQLEDKRDRQSLATERRELSREESKEREKLEENEWYDLQAQARDAASSVRMSGLWYECMFVGGSILLSFGLIAVGFSGQGAERWICLIMIAIITFSIYVAGAPWLQSVTSVLRS